MRHVAGDIAIELALSLAFELRLRNFHADHRGEAFPNVVAREVLLHILEQPRLLAECVDGARQGGAESGEVRAAIHRVDVVGEAEHVLRVAVVILQGHFHGDGALFGHLAVRLEVDRLFV